MFIHLCHCQKLHQSLQQARCYASLTKEQKEKLADGPDLGDFIIGEAKPGTEYTGNLKRKKGER